MGLNDRALSTLIHSLTAFNNSYTQRSAELSKRTNATYLTSKLNTLLVAFLTLKNWGLIGANLSMGAKTRGVRKEQFNGS